MGGYDKYWPQVYFISVVFALIHYIDWQADKPPDAGVRKHKNIHVSLQVSPNTFTQHHQLEYLYYISTLLRMYDLNFYFREFIDVSHHF